jgi:hypothetical protein
MSVEIKRVWYSYNNQLEQPYTLGVYAKEGDRTLVNLNETFTSRDEFMEKLEEIIPILESKDEGR